MKKLSPNEKCREKDFYHGAIKSFFSFIKKKGGQCKFVANAREKNQKQNLIWHNTDIKPALNKIQW